MTSLLILTDDIRQNETFKEKSGIFASIFTKEGINIYFSPNRMLTTWRGGGGGGWRGGGGRACTSMSRIAIRASSLINSSIFVHCQKQRIASFYEDRNLHLLKQKCGLQVFSLDSH